MKSIGWILLFLCLSNLTFAQKFSKKERKFITVSDTSVMFKIMQVSDSSEFKILKTISKDINPKNKYIPIIAKKMYLTMQDPANSGVGIAAPQIGINRNLIWVQRFDKSNEPFEFYINPKIIWRSTLLQKGTEGCLSIPNELGNVYRNHAIMITYFDRKGKKREEIIEGFTAVIFQHEIDHLNGILFTDRLIEQIQ